ncbi:MAG TPA: DUF192 domain-containing protein [Bryobacterales bacterium]|nr:DUF192 domain-containing protein [Bryobacterales bacterium]
MRFALPALLLALAAACSRPTSTADSEVHLPTLPVTLPNGKVIRAELATDPGDQQRGLMFRTSLAADRGMLFVFAAPSSEPFWMYHTLIPLDIIWLDAGHRIVFISANTPPCAASKGDNCPTYGGEQLSQFVLETPAGTAAVQSLKLGDQLQF